MFKPFARSQFESAPTPEPTKTPEQPLSSPEQITPPPYVAPVTEVPVPPAPTETPSFTPEVVGSELIDQPITSPVTTEVPAQPNSLHSAASSVMAEKQQNQQKAA